MTRSHTTTRRMLRLLGLACIVALLAAPLVWAGVEPTPFRTGLFGVTVEQTIRVSVLNVGDERGIIAPCIKIWDISGNLLFEAEGGPVPMGTGVFVDFGGA